MLFDYNKEPSRDVLCIDCKSFYASVECVERGLHPLKTMLVVMSNADNTGGLVLAASPLAKKELGISNVTRKEELPDHKDLLIVPPRMRLYMKKNFEINQIYQSFVANADHHVFSVDESFLDVTESLHYFNCKTAYELARKIQKDVQKQTGIYTTVGIGSNPLLAKLALDNEAKHNYDFIAEWRYKDVKTKVWSISPMTEFCGIGKKTVQRLAFLGIRSIKDLATADYYRLKDRLGVMGEQLYAHANGIDRSFLGDIRPPKETSIGNSQVLPKVYTMQHEIELVLCEIVDQVATRLRKMNVQTTCVSVSVGYPMGTLDNQNRKGFSRQRKITATNTTKVLVREVLQLFRDYYNGKEIRHVGVSFGKLVPSSSIQLDLFSDPDEQVQDNKLDHLVDTIRQKYGFASIVHATSMLEGATAISRASLVGGHAGGMEGLE